MSRLVAREIVHRFADHVVLSGLDFDVPADGTTVAIMAPSGAGKTTLLGILGGLVRPTGGSVTIDGERSRRYETNFSWIFQTTNSLPHRSTVDNVMLTPLAEGQSVRSASRISERQLLRVGLGGRSGQSARTLSGGELQRLAIARAMASDATFVLADEPTGQLDDSTSETVLDCLFGTIGTTKALVVVTHDSSVARRCSQVLTLVDGCLC